MRENGFEAKCGWIVRIQNLNGQPFLFSGRFRLLRLSCYRNRVTRRRLNLCGIVANLKFETEF